MDELYGYIESVVFASEEKGFTVARLKQPKQRELVTIVGVIPSVQPGETIRCKGNWKHHVEYGRQFEVESFELTAPSDLVGIQKYLESGMIKGIGPIYAERIVKAFGLETLEVIDRNPDKLHEVPGIGKKRVEKIKACWGDQRSIRDVMVFLRGHGVSPSFAQKIYKTYGERSVEKVRDNPYALAKEIFGIGFKSADQIAQRLGIRPDAPIRVDSGIQHVLWELSNEGHTCYPEADLIKAVEELLGAPLGEALERQAQSGEIIRQDGMVWVKPLYLAEVGILKELGRLAEAPSILRAVAFDKAVEWVEQRLKIELAPEQKLGVIQGITEKVSIITGGPGTGKSTITKSILSITEKLSGDILLCAPTGRAAKRMSEITGKKAFTIHSLLEMDFAHGGFKRNRENPLACSLIIVDEASMIDTLLMYHLLKAIPSQARVIFIGDIDQLPSVGPGNVLKDLIATGKIPVVMLKQIFRQAAGSRIVTNAHLINQGEMPDLSYQPKSDFEFIQEEDPEKIVQIILDLIMHKLRFHRFDEIQVLSPMRRGVIGIENLNVVLQKNLNPSPTPLLRMGRCFHIGDKVMQIRNNYEKNVYNGDVGRIIEIDLTDEFLKISFDGRIVEYEFLEIDELVLAYAVSIHKYQGSECPCVIIPIHTTHFILLYRNLLYTGITRGKRRVILVGSKRALYMAIKNQEVRNRYTGLS